MEKATKLVKIIQEYWLFITIAFAGLTGAVKFAHTYLMVPYVIEPMVRDMSYKLYSDSSDVWSANWMSKMPGGFGGNMAKEFGISKDSVVVALADIYREEQGRDMSTTYLMDRMTYQINFNSTVMLAITEPYKHNGVKMRKTATKENGKFDAYWKDDFGKWWKAVYYADEDGYFCFPDYTNGQRLKCE